MHDFIAEAVSTGDPQVSEVSLGDFYLSGEAIVGCTSVNIQSGLSTGIHRNHWLQTRLEPERSVDLGGVRRIERPRRATKPTRSAVEKRLDQKRRRGETKRLRRPPD